MTNTEKARSAAATVERAKTETGIKQTSASEKYSTTTATNCPQISDYLLCGAENGITQQHLEKITGMNGREIRRMIHAERLRGIPILANCKTGYFMPENDSERIQCVRSMKGRAREILRAAEAIERGRSIE